MALISCPECNKEVSDKAENCIHCGYPLRDSEFKKVDAENHETQQVEITSVDIKGGNLRKTIVSVLIIFAVVIAGVFIYNTMQERAEEAQRIEEEKIAEQNRIQAKNEYIVVLRAVGVTMLNGGAEAEAVSSLIGKIWYNAIYEEYDDETDEYTTTYGRYFVDDFNTAINNYMSSTEYADSVDIIDENQKTVTEMMRKLQSPTDELRNVYDTVTELHETYLQICKNATNPSGNLSTYNESFKTNVDKFLSVYDKLLTQIPEPEVASKEN